MMLSIRLTGSSATKTRRWLPISIGRARNSTRSALANCITGALMASAGTACDSSSRMKIGGTGSPRRWLPGWAEASTWPPSSSKARSRNCRFCRTTWARMRSLRPESWLAAASASGSARPASSTSTAKKLRLMAASAPLTKRSTLACATCAASCRASTRPATAVVSTQATSRPAPSHSSVAVRPRRKNLLGLLAARKVLRSLSARWLGCPQPGRWCDSRPRRTAARSVAPSAAVRCWSAGRGGAVRRQGWF